MLVNFKNTGMLKEANIRIGHLTVITGENDTGKSTIGKLLFSLIKTFNRYEKDALSCQVLEIKHLVDDFYFKFREKVENNVLFELGKNFFYDLKKTALSLLEMENKPVTEIESTIQPVFDSFLQSGEGISATGIMIDLEDLKNKLINLIITKPLKNDVFRWAFGKYSMSVLNGEVANKFPGGGSFSITGSEAKKKIFEMQGNDENMEITLHDRLYLEDATFFESPVLLNIADTIRFSKTEFDKNGEIKEQAELLEKSYVPEYMRDCILKLTEKVTRKDITPIEAAIREIIEGKFYYDHKQREFVFEKGNQTFKGVSIASGIKYLGAIGLLSQVGFLHKKSLIILDEPENHIHPDWQVKLVEVIIDAVQDGCNILLTSHSPYMLDALKVYAEKKLEKNKAAFYLSEKISGKYTSRIDNVSNDISPAFEKLSQPFRKIEMIDAEDIL